APVLNWKWRPYGMIGAAILVVVALIWVLSALIGAGRGRSASASATSTPASVSQTSEQAATATPSEADTNANAPAAVTITPANPGDFPPSRNARGDLGIGVKVTVVPGLRIALRSEPGADRGIVVGELSDSDVATIVGGPEYSAGDTDTI